MNLPIFRQFSPGLQLMLFFMIHFLGYGIAQLFTFLIARPFWHINIFTHPEAIMDFNNPSIIALHRAMFILFSLFVFITPALVFRKYMELPDQDYLFFRKRITWVISLGILVVFVFASPVINWLNELNLNIQIPGEFGEAISQVDKESNEYSMSILFTNDWSVFFTNLLVIGFLPALGEELFFRAVILRLFAKMFKNIHAAVWIGALFFSLYHFQFAGSIPRVFMGALLGYVFIITGNIWYSILLHFLNNAFIVILVFMQAKGFNVEDISNFGSKDWAIVAAIFSLIVLVSWGIYSWRKARHYQMESELLYR